MRYITFFFLVLFSNACVKKTSVYFIPKEFNFSDDKIGKGKLFIYENRMKNKVIFESVKLLNDNGKIFRITKRYDSLKVSDSTLIYNGQVIESYNFFISQNSKPIKAYELQDTVIYNHERLGVRYFNCKYLSDKTLNTINVDERFLKDTSIYWDDSLLPCIVTKSACLIRVQAKNDSTKELHVKAIQSRYFAKGIGLIRYEIDFTDHDGNKNNDCWNLKAIKEIL